MAEREPEQEFNKEDFKKLLRAGLVAARKRGGEIFAKISHEMNPDVKTEKYLKKKIDAMVAAGFNPKLARETVMKHLEKLLEKQSEEE